MTITDDDSKAATWLLYVAADLLAVGKRDESATAADLTARFLRGERGPQMLTEAQRLIDAFCTIPVEERTRHLRNRPSRGGRYSD